ncbi:Phenylacetate-coenzyme A ligase [Limihaloglobus sulfuriphilus]|uniref:Phenylacetate-coenzyme A ligase n=1 Tax=Limihaloglobus sulfuriphilus TaxID=1851148 RepID=A0A1Q2MHX4_9BACT|nr:phenylacetate--CoA ligase [Limihaloglobus sulfuriphilus]AQQ71897.1 Phenylacetate-coenzyme A ligase [Limihaloglobus sulfuriphilus]
MENSFFDVRLETLSQDEIKNIQLTKLKRMLAYVYENNPVQRKRFNDAGIVPEDLEGLEDLSSFPLMDKATLRDNYPLGLSCVEQKSMIEMHMSSGSTGTPVVMPYTENDLRQWAECMARCYCMAGAEKGDPIQITPSFGLFNGGFGMYHGARAAGLFIIPTGAGNTERQIKLARDFKTRIFTGVVSYGIRIMEVLAETGRDLPDLEVAIFGAEIFSDSLKAKIKGGLNAEIYDIYGMTETGGVGTLGQDCIDHSGIHVWEDHYIIEVINPDTGELLPDGEFGELVVTALTREALPVIRLRTGDLTRVLSRGKCACGRAHTKIESVTGRTDDMLIVKGVNFWPKQVEQALMKIPGAGANYQIILEEHNGVKDVRVNVEVEEGVTGFMVEKALKEALGFSPKGDVFPLGGLPRQAGKAKRVFRKEDCRTVQ